MKDGIALFFTRDGKGSAFAGTIEQYSYVPKNRTISVVCRKVATYATVKLALSNAGVNNAYVNLMNTAADASLESDWYKREADKAQDKIEMLEFDIVILKRKVEILQGQLQSAIKKQGQTP